MAAFDLNTSVGPIIDGVVALMPTVLDMVVAMVPVIITLSVVGFLVKFWDKIIGLFSF